MRGILGLALVGTAAVAGAAPRPGDGGTPEFGAAAKLVRQLGHPRFAVREAAAKELVGMAGRAVPALRAGLQAEDEEVRNRCAALLPQAQAAERERRADAYLADPDGQQTHDLPLLAEWDKLTGKPDAGSRRLFADMVRAHGDLLDQAARDPKPGAAAVAAGCRAVLAEVEVPGGRGQRKADPVRLPALLLAHRRVGGAADWATPDHPAFLLANPGLTGGLADREVGPPLRRLLAAWAESRPADDLVSHQAFGLTVYAHPFPEAVPVLARLAKDPKASGLNVRAVAVAALGMVGDGPARAALADLVSDATQLTPKVPHRVGDHALATLLVAGKKDPADYGLGDGLSILFLSPGRGQPVELTFRRFPDGGARKKGIEKWKAERAEPGPKDK